MSWAGWLYIFSVIAAAGLMFTMVYYIIMFSDLECDYINPIDLCSKLNDLTLPEAAFHATLTCLFLLCGQFLAFFLNLPLLLYNIHKYRSGTYLLDATEIFRTLSQSKKVCFIKLGFYLALFFFGLYKYVLFHHSALMLAPTDHCIAHTTPYPMPRMITTLIAGTSPHPS